MDTPPIIPRFLGLISDLAEKMHWHGWSLEEICKIADLSNPRCLSELFLYTEDDCVGKRNTAKLEKILRNLLFRKDRLFLPICPMEALVQILTPILEL